MSSQELPLRRLQRIEVERLFGIYDHRIDLQLDDRVTLLHGPNGVGKTTVLRMVDALLSEKIGYFRRVPFRRLLLGFHDGAVLELSRGDAKDVGSISLSGNGSPRSASVPLVWSRTYTMAEKVEFLEPVGDDTWIDIRDGERLTDTEVQTTPGGQAPLPTSGGAVSGTDGLTWLREFLRAANSHFIEAQRLVRATYLPRLHLISRSDPRPATSSRVLECSSELKKRIDDTMAEYGRRAQALDQSFPQRLLQRSTDGRNLPVSDIRIRMSELDRKTDELKKIGILETPIHEFQGVDRMDDSQAGVMTLYVDDTEAKLQVLEDLANRVRLLLASLNGKFSHKQIRVDREEGLVVDGESGPLPLDSLSSGEQHELILHYDLLFRVPRNTVVLLDEPELSLHIEWQSRFLSDLMAIVKLSGFDALVATHSPHIVGDRDDLMVELGG